MNKKDEETKEQNQDEIQELKEKLEKKEDKLLRLQAEFENYRKRTQNEKQKLKQTANKKLLKQLLPILDNFELALQNQEGKNFKHGVEMIFSQLTETLHDQGLQKIPTQTTFNPNLHEAVLVEEGKQNKILEELQAGYKVGEDVIRHAKVKISKKGDDNE